MEPEDILNKVYRVGYKSGWRHRDDNVPFLGHGDESIPDDIHLSKKGEWLADLYGNLDLSNIVYGRLKHSKYHLSDELFHDLYYLPHGDSCSDAKLRKDLHERLELGSIASGRTVDQINSDPAEYIGTLEEKVNELKDENKKLRATHPNADVDGGEDWELEISHPDHETSVPLDGDHVFDRAVIEFDTEVNAIAGEKGKVKLDIDFEELKLVSDS